MVLTESKVETVTRVVKLRHPHSHALAHTLAATEADEVAYVSDGAHVESPFLVYGREDEPCPRCATPLVRTKHAGRSTFLCPTCQPEP